VIDIPDNLATGPKATRGLLVSFSGVDGSGKTTNIRRLKGSLRRMGYPVRVFKLPSNECKKLALFTEYKIDPLTAESENRVDIFSMFLAVAGDRLNTIRTRIVPLLDQGYAVIVDRYLYSALCEVVISSSGLTRVQWRVVSDVISQFPTPHAAFFNRASFIEARKRINSREAERHDFVDPVLFNRRIDAFEIVRSQFGGVLVDTALDEHSCFKIITREIGRQVQNTEHGKETRKGQYIGLGQSLRESVA
jgi:dTMP kinase